MWFVGRVLCAAAGALLAGGIGAQGEIASRVDPGLLEGLHWRSIGPAVFGGRVVDVAGVPGRPGVVYVAHSSAGLFKSTDGGTTFQSVFDKGDTLSIGAIALSPEDPEVIYVGTGEGNPRNSASFGDGIYRSSDGGRTWKRMGLTQTERIARIAIDPRHPEVVLVAAMGHEWGPHPERGIFRSADGGATWRRVLHTNDTSGGCDVQFDPAHPGIAYAGLYDYARQPWHFRSGGPGSGLYRSTDGGETWSKLTDPKLQNGLPGGVLGRSGIAVAASNPDVVYAVIESLEKSKLWRSSDRGATWKAVSADPRINPRPFYFSNIRVDPTDENRVYALSGPLLVSADGGKSFSEIAESIHGDYHALWIDPANPERLLSGSDGGFQFSQNCGATWDFVNTLPFAQVYHVDVDLAEPYNVLAGFQDNEVWRGPGQRWNETGVLNGDWQRLINWGDGMHAVADPRDPEIIYLNAHHGDVTRVDLHSGERRYITPYPVIEFGSPAGGHRYRFNWNSPLVLSPSNPDVLYLGANVLFRTDDRGQTWKAMSPDLTTHDPAKIQRSGDPLSPDMSIAEYHCTITAIAESTANAEILWAGTDDGNVQVTRDGGKSWSNVASRIPGLPPNSWVTSLEASSRDARTVVAAFDRHQSDDFTPYVFVSHDFGNSWTKITDGLNGYVHVVREDPRQPDLLYAGTETGIFASFDAGGTWTDLGLGLPHLSVRDIRVHPRDNDLVIGTHARGIYILDDATPLQRLARVRGASVALFEPMPATRYQPIVDRGSLGDRIFVAPNRPYGAVISYYLARTPADKEVDLEILDSAGRRLRALKGTGRAGINRIVWNLREEVAGETATGPPDPPGYLWFDLGVRGPRVLPGRYTVRLRVGADALETNLTVRLNPRETRPVQALEAQHAALLHLAGMQATVEKALTRIAAWNRRLTDLEPRISDAEIAAKAGALRKELAEIQDALRNASPENRAPARLREQLAQLFHMVDRYDGPPTDAQAHSIETFGAELQSVLEKLDRIRRVDLDNFNERLGKKGLPAVAD